MKVFRKTTQYFSRTIHTGLSSKRVEEIEETTYWVFSIPVYWVKKVVKFKRYGI